MPRPNKSKKIEQGRGAGLGRALQKNKKKNRMNYSSQQQQDATEISATRIVEAKANAAGGLQSIIEQDDVSKLLTTADLAHREFVAEKLTREMLVEYPTHAQLLNEDGTNFDRNFIKPVLTAEELQYFIDRLVCVPRRPKWSDGVCDNTAEFQMAEQLAFHDWLARLANFEQDTGLKLTPFERNIEVWRQLWRVLERSHVVVQIVDCRNPLLYRNPDLDRYVKELEDGKKESLLLLNKADLLSRDQRRVWYEYFKSKGINVLFYSALSEANNNLPKPVQSATREHKKSESNSNDAASVISEDRAVYREQSNFVAEKSKFEALAVQGEVEDEDEEHGADTLQQDVKTYPLKNVENGPQMDKNESDADEDDELQRPVPQLTLRLDDAGLDGEKKPWDIVDSEQLIEELERFCEQKYGRALLKTQKYVVGLCGFPNVGKSSTLNSLIGSKKVAVSATPGRTKHFQTIHLTDKLILCDSPGLVMPTLVKNHAELIVNGVLPIDQLRESLSPVELIYKRIDHSVLEHLYGVSLPPHFSASDFLASFAFQRGMMSAAGRPDNSRAARVVIRHYTSGKLLYCNPPPAEHISAEEFFAMGLKCCFVEKPSTSRRQLGNKVFAKRSGINVDGDEAFFDRQFFGDAHIVGARNGRNISPKDETKPWKKHYNGKREKLRRKFVHLEA